MCTRKRRPKATMGCAIAQSRRANMAGSSYNRCPRNVLRVGNREVALSSATWRATLIAIPDRVTTSHLRARACVRARG